MGGGLDQFFGTRVDCGVRICHIPARERLLLSGNIYVNL